MLKQLSYGLLLLALSVCVHAVGMTAMLRWLLRVHPRVGTRFLPVTWLLIKLAWSLIAVHLVEIAIWALFFCVKGCMPDVESAFYFAGVTYTTLGYGDLVLPKGWEVAGAHRGSDGHSDVRLVHRLLFRGGYQAAHPNQGSQ
jgi:hypothetical protein